MSTDHSDERRVKVLRAGAEYTGKQGLTYAPGISAESVGSQGLHLQILRRPAGARAKAHKHDAHETAVYVVSGRSGMWYGIDLSEHVFAGEGDFLYIPPGVPHRPYNVSDTDPCVALIARTDPNEQESVVLLPHLDKVQDDKAA